GGQLEAGGVLQVAAFQLAPARHLRGQLDGLIHVGDLAAGQVTDHAGDVHLGGAFRVHAVQRDFVAGDGDRDGHVVAEAVEAEVAVTQIEIEGVVGDVGIELVLQLLFAVGGAHVVDVAGGVVAGARRHLDAGAVDLDADLAVFAIPGVVGAAVADEVVRAGIGLDFGVDGREVIGGKEGLAAGVVGQGGDGLLLGELGVEGVALRAAVEDAGAANAAAERRATGRVGLQAARIHAVDGGIGLDAGVDRRAQGNLVVHPRALHAAREVDQRFLLLNALEHVADGFDRLQAAVGIGDVELAVVGGEGRAVIGGAVARSGVARLEAAAGRGIEAFEDFEQGGFVGGEILVDLQRVAQGGDGGQIGRLHLLLDVGLGLLHYVLNVLGLHGGEVEVEHDQAPVAILGTVGGHGDRGRGSPFGGGLDRGFQGGGGADGGGGGGGRGGSVNVLEVEAGDVLRLAVLDQGHVAGLEVGDQVPFGVGGGEVDQDDIGVGLEDELRFGRGRRAGLGRLLGRQKGH